MIQYGCERDQSCTFGTSAVRWRAVPTRMEYNFGSSPSAVE